MEIIDGVHVVRDNAERLQWQHQMLGHPPPLVVKDWVVGGLWPDAVARARVLRVLEAGAPLLVVLEQTPAPVVLPVEHVRQVPDGVTVTDTSDGILTMTVPELEWLPEAERRRGEEFAEDARGRLAAESPLRRSAMVLEDGAAGSRPTRFVVLGSRSSHGGRALEAAVDVAFARPEPVMAEVCGS